MLPPEKNGYRSAVALSRSLNELDGLWRSASAGLVGAVGREQLWARETASMIANARWAYRSAEQRTESRGMHQRTDHPAADPDQRRRILVDGVDEPRVSFAEIADPVAAYDDDLAQQAA
jgi:succinate dehydrogenase/fumarate reductase flavoprotein subunit